MVNRSWMSRPKIVRRHTVVSTSLNAFTSTSSHNSLHSSTLAPLLLYFIHSYFTLTLLFFHYFQFNSTLLSFLLHSHSTLTQLYLHSAPSTSFRSTQLLSTTPLHPPTPSHSTPSTPSHPTPPNLTIPYIPPHPIPSYPITTPSPYPSSHHSILSHSAVLCLNRRKKVEGMLSKKIYLCHMTLAGV